MANNKAFGEFMTKLKEETRIYTNFHGIMEKAERDGYLQSAHQTLSEIFQKEMKFAVVGCLNRAQEDQDQKPKNCD